MTSPLLIGLALAAGCGNTHTIGNFIHSVEVEDGELVFERCAIEQRKNVISADKCTRIHRRLPMTAQLPETIESAKIVEGISLEGRKAVSACGVRHGATGTLNVRLKVNYTGKLFAVEAKPGGPELADCVGSALAASSFPPSIKGAEAEVPFVISATP